MSTLSAPIERHRRHDFQDLMRHRIMDILLVSTPYDSFILEEAGRAAGAAARRVPEPRPPLRPRPHERLHGRRGAGALPGEPPLQPHRHHPPRGGHERGRARPKGPGGRPRRPRRPARLGHPRAHGVHGPGRHLGPRADLPLAGRRPHPRRHRQVGRGPPQRGARQPRGGRAGDHPRRGQRPLLLVVPARDVHGAAPPLAARDRRGPEPLPEDPAHAGPPQGAPLHDVRGGGGGLRRPRRRGAGRHLRHRVPAREGAVAHRGRRARPPRPGLLPRRAPDPALLAARERGARREPGRELPAEGLAPAPPGPAARDAAGLRLRRLRVPPSGRKRSGPRRGPARPRGPPRDRPRGERHLPRRAQPLLALAQGPHRVRARAPAAPAQALRLRGRGGPAAQPDLVHRGLPPRAEPRRGGGLRPRDLRPRRRLLPHRRRLPGRQGPRPGLRAPPAEPEPARATASRASRSPCPPRWSSARTSSTASSRTTTCATSPSSATTRRRSSAGSGAAGSPRIRAGTSRPSSRRRGGRWPSAPRACSRTRSTSPSPGSTTRSCCRTTRRAWRSAGKTSSPRSSGSTPPPSRLGPRPTCAPLPTGWRRRRWRWSSSGSWAPRTGPASTPTSRVSLAPTTSIPRPP